MGSHTIKGANNKLYIEDPTQNPYSTGLPEEYTYIPQEVQWNIAIKINNQSTQEHSTFVCDNNFLQNKKPNKKNKTKDQPKPNKKICSLSYY